MDGEHPEEIRPLNGAPIEIPQIEKSPIPLADESPALRVREEAVLVISVELLKQARAFSVKGRETPGGTMGLNNASWYHFSFGTFTEFAIPKPPGSPAEPPPRHLVRIGWRIPRSCQFPRLSSTPPAIGRQSLFAEMSRVLRANIRSLVSATPPERPPRDHKAGD